MANIDDDQVVSMVDVLEEGNELEEEAAAVLGDSDDRCCTYPLGYMKRQALYACMTCRGGEDSLAGICLACSYECHDGHDFVELYTKRNFRCDCGNSKFQNLSCKLIKVKQPKNPDNKYNHNFTGVYCVCKRPYPDPEDEIEDEMIQCVVCEDWFHGRHLGSTQIPESGVYQEMVCQACMDRCDFLWNYTLHSLETKVVKEESSSEIDVTSAEHEEKKPETPSTSKPVEREESSVKETRVATGGQDPSTMATTSTQSETSASNTAADCPPSTLPATSDATVSSSSGQQDLANKDSKTDLDGGEAKSEPSVVSSSTSSSLADAKLSEATSLTDANQAGGDATAIHSSQTDVAEGSTSAAAVSVASKPSSEAEVKTSLATTSHSCQTLSATAGGDNIPKQLQQPGASTSSNTSAAVKFELEEAGSSRIEEKVEKLSHDVAATADTQAVAVEGDEENAGGCRLKELSSRRVVKTVGAVFWPIGWRTKLCTCTECQALYERLEVSFLQDPEDTVIAYEERGKGKRKRSQYDQGMEALSNMNRVQQAEMLYGYQDMKTALSDFLKTFAEQGKVVTASDIQEFYESLNRKRQRVGPSGTMQYTCR